MTACYRDNLTFVYVDDVRTSQETRPLTGRALFSYMYIMFVPHRKHISPWPVTVMALLIYMLMMFLPHWKHKPPRPFTGIALLFLYVDAVRTSQETPVDLHGLLQG
jgi:hypothetical protein